MSAIWIVWSALGLAGWWVLFRRPPAERWRAPAGDWHAADVAVAGLFGILIVAGILSPKDDTAPITLAGLQGGAFLYVSISLVVVALSMGRGGQSWPIFGLAPARPGRVAALGVAGLFLTFPLVQMMQELAQLFGPSPGSGDRMVQLLLGNPSPAERLWAIGLAAVVAPVTEELFFRGYLYGVFKRFGGRLAAMLTSAALFAASHDNVPALPALFLLAIGFTLIYELTGSLWASITMHVIFNVIPLVIILAFPEWLPKP